jgi:type I restriction enzyme S subunit
MKMAYYPKTKLELQPRKLSESRSFNVPIISPDLQQEFAGKLGVLQTKVENLEFIYQRKLNVLAELKQSILHKAFTGELTAKTVDKIMEPV